MIKRLGIIFGVAFSLGGILGFVPGIIEGDMYLGIFMVNPAHNAMHIVTGAIFLIASMLDERITRLWFQIFGLFYAALAVMGFAIGEGMIFNLIMNNRIDSWGHAGLALIILLIGFTVPARATSALQAGQS
jgi:hypothetical protein